MLNSGQPGGPFWDIAHAWALGLLREDLSHEHKARARRRLAREQQTQQAGQGHRHSVLRVWVGGRIVCLGQAIAGQALTNG